MSPKGIVLLVVGLLFALFVIQNAQVVEVRFLFWKTQAPRALILLGTLALGIVAGWLLGWARQREQELEKKRDS
jgi:uncharacterized integral membrane protein